MTTPHDRAIEAAAKAYAKEHVFDDDDLGWIVQFEIEPTISAYLAALAADTNSERKPTSTADKELVERE